MILILKEVQNGTKSGSPIVKTWRNFGENGEICDVTRFACVLGNYEINYDLRISCNNQTKLCRQKIPEKGHFNAQKNLSSRQQCRSQTPLKDFIICFLFTFVDETFFMRT